MFFDVFETKRPEKLSTLLRNKYGYTNTNPGPVVAFQPNRNFFPTGYIPEDLPKGTKIVIPWTQARLQKQIKIDTEWVKGRKTTAKSAAKRHISNTKETSDIAFNIDLVVAILLIGSGATKLIHSYTGKTLTGTAITAEKLSKLKSGMTVAGGAYSATSYVLKPITIDSSIVTGSSKKFWTWSNITRHALSITNLSYWASLAAVGWCKAWGYGTTEDSDVWKYGLEGARDKRIDEIYKRFKKEVRPIINKIILMNSQLEMPFYKYRISTSNQLYKIPQAQS